MWPGVFVLHFCLSCADFERKFGICRFLGELLCVNLSYFEWGCVSGLVGYIFWLFGLVGMRDWFCVGGYRLHGRG